MITKSTTVVFSDGNWSKSEVVKAALEEENDSPEESAGDAAKSAMADANSKGELWYSF